MGFSLNITLLIRKQNTLMNIFLWPVLHTLAKKDLTGYLVLIHSPSKP